MPVATTPSVSPRPATLSKMEDRKRPAASSTEDQHPSKRQQTTNGNKTPKGDAGDQSEEHWIENYQKGAIYRAFQEIKREKNELETRVEELKDRVDYRDDQIRITEAWWNQLLEEMELLVDPTLPAPQGPSDPPYMTGVMFKDSPTFKQHLDEKTESFRRRAEAVLNRISSARGEITPSVADLEARVNSLLAQQKDYLTQLDRAHSENQQLSEDLDKKTLKVIKADRKAARLKSSEVKKLEQQFQASANQAPASGENGTNSETANGGAEALLKLEEASAVVNKQKDQIEAAQTELQKMTEENSALRARRENLTDEDFIRTDVFKAFKSQNEDLIKRVNHLEHTNKQLRDDAERLSAERTSFRTKLTEEAQNHISDLERQVEERESDVTRLRTARDEWFAKASTLEASQKEEKTALQHIKELASAREERINALELELSRLQPNKENDETTDPVPEVDDLPTEELLAKYKKLQQDFESINKELPALQQAYKRSMSLAQKKVMDFSSLEDRVATLLADKQKADQKYFAVRKDADLRDRELGALRSQNRKSSEIVSQLKDVEAQNKVLISNLEKQLADLRHSNASVLAEHKKMEASNGETTRRAESLKNHTNELTNLVKSRDSQIASLRERNTAQETEAEKLKARVEFTTKDRDEWRRKATTNSSDEEQMLRTFALCTVCRINFKNTALKTCGHLFCDKCIDNRISNRMRKCPTCGKAFDRLDSMLVHH